MVFNVEAVSLPLVEPSLSLLGPVKRLGVRPVLLIQSNWSPTLVLFHVQKFCWKLQSPKREKKYFYYINTNEIPGKLSRENMISSHVKITCYLHTWKDHRCYGYIINRAFCREKWMVWYFTAVYIINKTLHGRSVIRNFSSCVEKYFNTWREIPYLRAAL